MALKSQVTDAIEHHHQSKQVLAILSILIFNLLKFSYLGENNWSNWSYLLFTLTSRK
jgi:hypothetical protein